MKKICFLFLIFFVQLHAQDQWLDISPPGAETFDFNDVYAKGSRIICVGDNLSPGSSVISTSNDNGLHWQNKFITGFAKTVAFQTANEGYIAGYSASLKSFARKSNNGGATWGAEYSLPLDGFKHMAFKDSLIGYAWGYNVFLNTGAFFHTTTAGSFWDVVYTNNTHPLDKGWMAPDGITGYAFEFLGKLKKTTDGGHVWNVVANAPNYAEGIYFWDANKGIMCWGSGKVSMTTNGGASWTAMNTGGNTEMLYDIDFYDNNYGFCVGNHGTVLMTTDGGLNWTSETLPGAPLLSKIEFHDSKAYAIGAAGKVYQYSGTFTTVAIPEAYAQSQISLYPNPASTELTLNDKAKTLTGLRICNLLGECVYEEELPENTEVIDVSALAPAVYCLELQERNGHWFTRKFVKE